MTLSLHSTALYARPMYTRMPFRYGVATLTSLPHAVLRVEVEVDGVRAIGVAADGLAPKWFTKYPETTYAQDLASMIEVIDAARQHAKRVARADSPFDFWHQVYTAQAAWAAGTNHPPLLWGFGVSLVERALIDGYCRAIQQRFADAVRRNTLGIDLGAIHAELAGSQPSQWLPAQPTERLLVRHTVGLGDPLDRSDLSNEQRVNDGLPETLVECIETYGLTHFKIKLGGTPEQDLARLSRIALLLEDTVAGEYVVTLDGNEQYRSMADLQQFWHAVEEAESLHKFRGHIAFVEQPLHRDATLSDEVGLALAAWDQHPPLLIDESDGSLESLPRGLALGYCGTSHKNCKGVFKSIANRSLIAHRQQLEPARRLIMSAEDLSTVGPVALLQDLAVIATLGLTHAERNGHHYFRGLEMWPPLVGEVMLAHHGDLYTQHAFESYSHPKATPTLDIRGGAISLASVLNASFGLGVELPFDQLMGGDEVLMQFGLDRG